ncbi:MAG TPA: PepSY-associated TM helix domain-containing protein, partial [Steroidobacter sp.]|nr:PepSY-associated TM helix domain-containing protein [Steroidobacter sp.]
MRAATLRSFLAVHTWVGLIAGLGLFIGFYAGAVIVFADELGHWTQVVERDQPRASLEQAQPLIDAVLARHPEAAHGFSLRLPDDHDPRLWLYWYETNRDGGRNRAHRFELEADGSLVDSPGGRPGFVGFIDVLHYTAGLPKLAGTYLFGVFCILYGLALVSGIVIYAPAFLKDLFALRVGKNLKQLWRDAHNVIGVLSLPFHVIFAWSGAVLTIGMVMLAPFQFLVFENKLLDIVNADLLPAPHEEVAGPSATPLPVTELLKRVHAALPELAIETLSYEDANEAHAQLTALGQLRQGRMTSTGTVVLDAIDGEVLRVLEPETFSPGRAFLQGLTRLHYGR